MHCPIDIKLVDQYAEATQEYFGAVNALTSIAGTKNGPSFHDSYREARRKHKDCESAREAIEEHRAKHACQAVLLPRNSF